MHEVCENLDFNLNDAQVEASNKRNKRLGGVV